MYNLLLNEFDVKSYERWIRAESKAEDIIELLEDVGEVPNALRSQIIEQVVKARGKGTVDRSV